jgi:chemotaxis protein MotB
MPWVLLVIVVGVAGAAGFRLYHDGQAASAAASAASAKAMAAEAAQKEQQQKLEKLESEKTELAAARDELAKDVEAKTGELAALKGTYDKLEERMKDEIAKGDIRLSQSGGKLRVDLVDKILFDSGEAAVSARGEGVLARVGAVLAAIDDKQIQVSGHTDRTPISEKLAAQFPSNWELSAARAITVVRFLEEKAGVPPGRMVASGYGEHHPIASNKNAAGRARNRRIEILLTPSLDPKEIERSKLKAAEAEAAALAAKSETKPEAKPETKAETKPEAKVETKSEAKSEDKVAAKTKAESKPKRKKP